MSVPQSLRKAQREANSHLCLPPHPAPQISEKLSQLQARRQETADKWQEKMDWLQLGEGAGPSQEGLRVLNPVVSRVRPGTLGMEFEAPALGSALCSCLGQ